MGIRRTEERKRFHCRVRHGHAVEEILAEIEAVQPDLLLMSTHGWRGIARLLMGSVTEKLVRLSPVPVLTFGTGQWKAAEEKIVPRA